jgi:hypothetical protein
MKIIVNGQEVTPCKKHKLTDNISNVDIESLIKKINSQKSKK